MKNTRTIEKIFLFSLILSAVVGLTIIGIVSVTNANQTRYCNNIKTYVELHKQPITQSQAQWCARYGVIINTDLIDNYIR